MTPKVEFHFDFGSPNAYLAHLVIPEIEARTGAKFAYVPVLLGGVFTLTGNRSPAEAFGGIRNKPEYERLETERLPCLTTGRRVSLMSSGALAVPIRATAGTRAASACLTAATQPSSTFAR